MMFGPAGRLYTYRSHGIHVCANVVCATDDVAGAVLLRAAAIESGLDVAQGRRGDSVRPAALARGPGNLCSALGITMEDNGIDLFDAKSPIRLMLGEKHDGVVRPARRRQQGGRSALADCGWPGVPRCRSIAAARGHRLPAKATRCEKIGAVTSTGASILDELEWRGLIAQSTDRDALAAALAAGPVTVYSGFDPTAPSLHAGHLIPLLTLRRFQQAGHRPIVLAGGATGMIGDPRDIGERTLNNADTVAEWADRIRGQLERFVEFDDSPTGAVVENNLTWTAEMPAIEFLRDVGKHFSVNVMLDRDTVRRRLEGEGISYTEFSYMLLQANDYVELHQRYGCALQIGGSDQWGNIIAGVRLVRQKTGATVHALTTPLVTDSEGQKFGKSTGGGSLWLDPEMTSPYAWYQYFVNTADADVVRYLRWFTFLSPDELAELEEATAERPHERAGQRRLARELTNLVHGEAATESVEHASQALFGRGELDAAG